MTGLRTTPTNPSGPRLLVSMHDVAPTTFDACRRWIDLLDERGIPVTLLAVPGPWRGVPLRDDPACTAWLRSRAAGGDEVGLHGWAHRADEHPPSWRQRAGHCVARGAEEFWLLDARTAAQRVRAGLAILADAGLAPVGFTPPGWLIGPHARHAVRTCGLRYIADHRGVHGPPGTVALRAPALSHRSNGVGERLGAHLMTTMVRRRAAVGADVRIALHPGEIGRAHLVRTTIEAIDVALAHGATPTTYADAAAVGVGVGVGVGASPAPAPTPSMTRAPMTARVAARA